MADNDFIWRFTPSRTEPELLESIFVQRHALLTDIQERVADSATTGNMHHVLLIGPRGIGKTHLISLLHHRVTQDAALNEKLRIAWFLEDETITSFVQLLKRIYELLSDEHPQQFPKAWLESQLEKSPAQIEKNLEAELVRQFQGKTLLLFIENLDYVFDGLGAEGQKKWRSFLQEHPFTCIVATSQRLFRGVQKRTEPFFGFFAPIHLRPLTVNDAVELLSHIAQRRGQTDLLEFLHTPDGRSRVRAIHHLAGGNHRIYIVLSGFITRESLDELTQPFEKMADELTPYYQERMRWLSPQQRQIVEFLCNQNSPCTPKEMARELLAAENTISSQLKKLLEYGYVLRSPRGRESLYELAEPLMRLASEIKEKRKKPLRLLVEFLRIWYSREKLIELSSSTSNETIIHYLNEAIKSIQYGPDPRLKAIADDILNAGIEKRSEELVTALEELAHVAPDSNVWSTLGHYQFELQQFDAAIASCDKAIGLDPHNLLASFTKSKSLVKLGCVDDARVILPLFEQLVYRTRPDKELQLTLNTKSGLKMIAAFARNAALGALGEALILNLRNAQVEGVSSELLDSWRDLWLEAGSQYPEMEVPLRIFRVGIEYLKTKDERVMLDLIATERRILRQALGLEEMTDDEPKE